MDCPREFGERAVKGVYQPGRKISANVQGQVDFVLIRVLQITSVWRESRVYKMVNQEVKPEP